MKHAGIGSRPIRLRKRSDLHLARKIWHISAVASMAAVYALAPNSVSMFLIIAACAIFIPIDLIRLRSKKFNAFMTHYFHFIMREYEAESFAGTTPLLIGTLITAVVFPREIVLMTLLFLAFADPVASFFGIMYGKDKLIGNKSLQGSLAAFVVCTIITFYFLNRYGVLMDRMVVVSLLGGLVGAFAELVPIGKMDDNLSLPLISSSLLWVLFKIFGLFSSYQTF